MSDMVDGESPRRLPSAVLYLPGVLGNPATLPFSGESVDRGRRADAHTSRLVAILSAPRHIRTDNPDYVFCQGLVVSGPHITHEVDLGRDDRKYLAFYYFLTWYRTSDGSWGN